MMRINFLRTTQSSRLIALKKMPEDQNLPAGQADIPEEKSEKVNEKTLSAEQAGSVQQSPVQLQTENMEVHHHPHLHYENKKWKEYFLEFAMIFLAVTASFFAENIREHISDRGKEEEYIRSFIQNLQDDTAQLKYVLDFNIQKIKGVDSFLLLSAKKFSAPSVRQAFYNYASKYFFSEEDFRSNDATLA